MRISGRFLHFGCLMAAALLAAPTAWAQASKPARESVLRVVPHANLVLLDPTWTSIYITRNHGYMIYDTLFARDAEGKVRPQMVDTYTTSPDGMTWTFTLRGGLKWHDGNPVTAEDCVASLRRWATHSGIGQQLFASIAEIAASDDKTFVMKMKAPYSYVLDALGQLSSYVPFMLPRRLAESDPNKPIAEHVGSGPFVFKQDEFVPGEKAVYLKNYDYVPRAEPPSWAAGGKLAKVDRLEWVKMPSQEAAVDALLAGRVDYVEEVSPRLVGRLERSKDVVIGKTGPDPYVGMARFNHQVPPFNNAGVRRAAMMAMRQTDYLSAAVGPQKYWSTCYSVYPCKSPFASETGSDFIKSSTLEDAKKALAAAGYDDTPVVLLNAVDFPVVAVFNRVTAAKLRAMGITVVVRDTTWAEMTERRARRSGWNLFHTYWSGVDLVNPEHIAFSGDPVNGWFGWADDKELEQLRSAFSSEANFDARKKLAAQIQERMWAIGAEAFLGEFYLPVAFRSKVEGAIVAPVQFYWNMSIKR